MITAELDGRQASVLLGDGKGGFPTIFNNPGGGGRLVGVAIGDLNGDKKPDAVLTDLSNDRVVILLGDGTGKLTYQGSFAVQSAPEEVVLVDLNRDGKLDFVVTNNNSNTVSTALGKGDGTFDTRVDLPV